MLHQSRNAAWRGLSVRTLISIVAQRPAPAATAGAASPPTAKTGMRALPRLASVLAAGLLAMAAVVAPAAAQQPVMTITGATPASYSGPGQTITFHVSLGNSNAVTNSVELTRIAYGTVGPIACANLPLDPYESTTCSFTYITQTMDVFGLNQSGTFRVTTLAAPRTQNIANTFSVPYVPVASAPTASISVAPASVSEDGAANLVYTVSLSAPAVSGATVNYTVAGTATAGSDYSALSGVLAIPAGGSTGTLTVNPIPDSVVEANETVLVSLGAGTGYTVGSPASATGTIVNDEVVVAITPPTVPSGTVGAAYSQSLGASGGASPYSFVISSGALPAGLTLSAGGVLSGTPTAAGTFNFMVTATDANGVSGARAYSLAIAGPIITIAPSTLSAGAVAAAYSQNLAANNGVAPYSFAVTAGALPAGLTVSPAGVLAGTPTAGGAFNFTVRATDSSTGAGAPFSGARAYSLVIAAPTISIAPATLPNATAGRAYSQFITASFGTGPFTYAITAGSVPAGLTLSAAGVLSGTPTVAGISNFTVTATDSSTGSGPYAGSRAYSVTTAVPAPVAGAVSATVGYNSSGNPIFLNLSGGAATSVAVVTAAAHGTTAASGTSIYYTPTAGYAGADSFTYTASNTSGTSAPATVTITVVAPMISVGPSTLPNPTAGTAYSQTISASGGAAPYSFAVVAGTLPAGLALSAAGVLSGTPTAAGPSNFTVRATDSSTGSGPSFGSRAYSVTTIVAAPVAGAALASVAYNSSANPITLNLSGGAAASVAMATAAAHGTVTASGTSIYYTPTAGYAGADSFTYTASNASGTSAPATVSVTVLDPFFSVAADGALATQVGAAFSRTFTWSGGAAPYSGYSVSGLPSGLSITSTSGNSLTVSGTPVAAGSFNLNLIATDSSTGIGPFTVGQAFTLTVSAPTLALTPAAGTIALVYNTSATLNFIASGGTAPYRYALTSGTLPTGVSFTPTGVLSGASTMPGSYPVTISVTDSSTGAGAPFSVAQNYVLQVGAPSIVISPATLPDGDVATPYAATLTASGGVGPYSFSLIGGALPVGVSLSPAGQFYGTPRSDGIFNVSVRATDANGQAGTQSYTFNIGTPTLAISPATLPGGTTNIAYSQALASSGGIAPYVYSLVSGSLPAGLSFSPAGVFSGTPTIAGNTAVIIRSTDDAGYAVDATYTLAIISPTIVLDPSTLPVGIVGDAYAATLTATGGAAPYAFTVESGALPSGVSLDSAGGMTGTPNATGTFTFDVRATDSNGNSGTRTLALTLAARTLVLAPASLVAATAGTAYTATFNTSGGIAPYAYALSSGALPAGLSLANGVLAGTPTRSGNFSFAVTVTDSTRSTVTGSYTLVVVTDSLVLDPAILPNGTAGTTYSQTITATSGIAPYRYALTAGALPAGLGFANGTLSGTPTVSGSFSFDITATDSTGGAAATTTRSYTLLIAADSLVLDPASLPNGTAGTGYSQTLTATGGIAPYSYALTAGALPAGLGFANGTLSGTPTVSGSFSFDITATDSTGGTAATATRSYTLGVDAPAIAITPTVVAAAVRGDAYTQAFAASGGTSAYAFTVSGGALPAGLALAADGMLTGTPTVDGTFNFAVTVTDALGFTGTGSYTLAVAQNAPGVVDDVATTLGEVVVRIPVTGNDTGTITSITISSAPAHGSATVDGLEVVYTPEAGFSGNDSLGYLASGPGGTSVEATVTVTVSPLPVAVSRRLAANAGTAVEVDLTEGASGGPFTAAALVSLSPADSGTIRIVQVGSGDTARFVLTYTPAAAFSGLATLRFTLANAYTTSAEASIEFDVSGRPDPSQDPEVRALLAAQVASTRRFATAQIDNFQQRLENLHGQGGSRFSSQVSFSADSHCEEQVGRIPGQRCDARANHDDVAHVAPPASDAAATDPARKQGTVGTWIGGMIRSGNHDGRGGSAGIDFETDGLSVGADYRVNADLALGAGFGWGRDSSLVGDHGSRSEGKAYTAALYASYHPGGRFFVDGLMGYQDLSYELRRYVTASGGLLQGAREGNQWFASLSAGADFRHGEQLQLTPYARLDLARARLDGYTEQGDALYALRYADMDVDTSTGNVGLRIDYRQQLSRGLFSPQLRLEYQHDFQGGDSATLGYADQLYGPFYRSGMEVFDRNRFLIGLGAQFSTDAGLSTRIEYRGVVGNSEEADHGLMLNLEKRY